MRVENLGEQCVDGHMTHDRQVRMKLPETHEQECLCREIVGVLMNDALQVLDVFTPTLDLVFGHTAQVVRVAVDP